MCYHCLHYQILFLQITKCNPMIPYNITGLQSFSSYTVGVAACTIAGEGSPSTVTGSVMTSAGTPAPVGVVTATGSNESSVTFSWSDVNFNGMNSGYMVSIKISTSPHARIYSLSVLHVHTVLLTVSHKSTRIGKTVQFGIDNSVIGHVGH